MWIELNVETPNLVVEIKDFYFLKKFVYLKANAILPFMKWMILIVDYVEIWKILKSIGLLEVIIV